MCRWQGLLSTVEKVLPIADEVGAISLLNIVVNTSPGVLNAAWVSPAPSHFTHPSLPSSTLSSREMNNMLRFCRVGRACYFRGGTVQHVRLVSPPAAYLSAVILTLQGRQHSVKIWDGRFGFAVCGGGSHGRTVGHVLSVSTRSINAGLTCLHFAFVSLLARVNHRASPLQWCPLRSSSSSSVLLLQVLEGP